MAFVESLWKEEVIQSPLYPGVAPQRDGPSNFQILAVGWSELTGDLEGFHILTECMHPPNTHTIHFML